MFFLTGAASGFAITATILVGQCIGAGNVAGAKCIIGTSAIFFATISVLAGLAGLALTEPLLLTMMTPGDALPLAVAYLRMMFLALPSMYMYTLAMSVLHGTGNSKILFHFILVSVALAMILNPLFIFGLGPIPRAGIAGAAFATMVAQTLSLTALVVALYRRRHPLCLYKEDLVMLRVDWSILRALVRNGVPTSTLALVAPERASRG